MKITKVVGREIYDSRGWPTVQCEIELDHSRWVKASVPAVLPEEHNHICDLRDGGSRLWGRGVLRAVEHIEYIIGPALIGLEPDGGQIDTILCEIDGTADRSHLGGNAILAVSMAVHRAQAVAEGCELFELLAQLIATETVTIPFPQITLVSSTLRTEEILPVHEVLVVPVGMHHFRSAMELSVTIFHELRTILERHGKVTNVGDEGSFEPSLTIHDALLSACDALQRASTDEEIRAVIALDMATSQRYDPLKKRYMLGGNSYSTLELIDWYEKLIELYPIYSLEDPFAAEDWDGWRLGFERLGDKIQIVADDFSRTNSARIQRAITERCMSAVTIKLHQVGTISEALQVVKLCQLHELNLIISHEAGETNDSFIADLSVGVSAGQIKVGGCARGERIAKYNRLLWIEDYLFWDLLGTE